MLPSRGRLALATATLLFLMGHAGAQIAANPFIGYWKLNLNRSTFAGTPPEGYFNFRRYEETPNGWVAHTAMSGTAKTGDFLFTVVRYDEKEYPVYNSATLATFLTAETKPDMMVAFKRIDERTIEYTDRIKGRISSRGPCTVSRDGTTLTIVSHAFDAEGKERSVSTMVYERYVN
jgi:hypothetical protein